MFLGTQNPPKNRLRRHKKIKKNQKKHDFVDSGMEVKSRTGEARADAERDTTYSVGLGYI